MKGYKVIREENDKLFSCWVLGQGRVEYRIGKSVEAPSWLAERGYHLTFFKTLRNARRFASNLLSDPYRSIKIYRCEVKEPLKNLPSTWLMTCGFVVLGASLRPWPKGTKMAKGIKLLREVF
jgi:hypothetical protein